MAGRGLDKLRGATTRAIATLFTLNATGAAIRATWWAAMHSVQSWSGAPEAWKCAACTIPLIRTSAMQTTPKMARDLEKAGPMLLIR